MIDFGCRFLRKEDRGEDGTKLFVILLLSFYRKMKIIIISVLIRLSRRE